MSNLSIKGSCNEFRKLELLFAKYFFHWYHLFYFPSISLLRNDLCISTQLGLRLAASSQTGHLSSVTQAPMCCHPTARPRGPFYLCHNSFQGTYVTEGSALWEQDPIGCITMFINSTAEFNMKDWVAERRGESEATNKPLLQTLLLFLFISYNNLNFDTFCAQISLGLLRVAAQQDNFIPFSIFT